MSQAILDIFMRYLHIVSAIGAMGGLMFLLFCFKPPAGQLESGAGDSWVTGVLKRFDRVMWLCIAGLIISGVYNWVGQAPAYKAMGPKGNALIGTKVLLALIVFVVFWARTNGWIKPRAAMMINIHLAAIVVLLGSILRYCRLA